MKGEKVKVAFTDDKININYEIPFNASFNVSNDFGIVYITCYYSEEDDKYKGFMEAFE